MIAVSACLAGERCRYDGGANLNAEIAELVRTGEAVCICPELLGGMSVPRSPSEIVGSAADVLDGKARVLTRDGADVTSQFVDGAKKALTKCVALGVSEAILKARSPSCGCGEVYDGSFSSRLTRGNGVAAELLMRNGINVTCR